jgi:hypothetical protein
MPLFRPTSLNLQVLSGIIGISWFNENKKGGLNDCNCLHTGNFHIFYITGLDDSALYSK